jgi:hypothetical protein
MQFHAFMDRKVEDGLVASKKQCLLGVQGEDSWSELFETFPFFLIFIAAMQIVIASEPELP